MNAHPIEHRQNLQKSMTKTFGKQLRTLDTDLQLILIDDMVTAFFNRLKVLEKIQETQKRGK